MRKIRPPGIAENPTVNAHKRNLEMALIAMAIYDTPENYRADMTRQTLESLVKTVDFARHRAVLIVNEATDKTIDAIIAFCQAIGKSAQVIYLQENIGTARAINKAWLTREPGENAIKMDNDVVIHSAGWVDEMEEAIQADPKIGIIGLKRKDCWENPAHESDFYRSELMMLPHKPGEPWIVVERVNHVIGTCQMYSAELLDKIGYLYQPGLYGWDDVLAAERCKAAGFYSCFLPHFRIDHIDPGATPYQGWKERIAWDGKEDVDRLRDGYKNGTISIYYGPE